MKIINFFTFEQIFQMRVPPFGASLHLELYKHGHEYYVQLFYRKDKSENPPPIEIPNCGIKCPLDRLIEIEDILPIENESHASLCRL